MIHQNNAVTLQRIEEGADNLMHENQDIHDITIHDKVIVDTINDSSNTETKLYDKVIIEKQQATNEGYHSKLGNNLQCLGKNHVQLPETQNISEVLDKNRKCVIKPKRNQNFLCTKENINESEEYSCNIPFKCDNCFDCSNKKWEPKLKYKKQKKRRARVNKDLFDQDKCTCYETTSSSNSETLCECQQQLNDSSYTKNNADIPPSNYANDNETVYSNTSRFTCFCSKNESHEDLSSTSDNDDTNTKKFRGDVDAIHVKAKFLDVEKKCKLQNKKLIMDHLKFVKVDELREGLQRLQIRNRNLKNLLYNLKDPLNVMNKSSEITSLCTTVSSSYVLDLNNQTHSNLITVIKVLENKCRNKDTIIATLANELRTINDAKLCFKSKTEEAWTNITHNTEMNKKFKTKDSIFGFIFLTMILLSYVKVSDIAFYLQLFKKNLLQMVCHMFLFIKKSEKFFPDLLLNYEKLIQYSILVFFIGNHHYIAFISSVIVSIVFVIKLRNRILTKFKISNSASPKKFFNLYEPIKSATNKCLRILCDQVLCSRMFWFIMGFYTHTLWNIVQQDLTKLIDLFIIYYTETMQIMTQEIVQDNSEEPSK
ncbi:PREDICTED: uncharacterized protein LOC105365129 [Ceratosolen solmsi marchali]|uniref:Uncharacterized protein LOC105365129 n=1 Tax=Ceratosolen solmsi marchali TaxID=326594 RepID=A0AAJ7DYY1_9HYME|nr:PREDICTED: uncharacterized protein LOC105365129 [Ceratosolen solmsi marchali]